MRKNSVALYSTLSILIASGVFAIKDVLKDSSIVSKQDKQRFLVSSDIINFHNEPLNEVLSKKKEIITFNESPLGKIILDSQVKESIDTPEVKVKLSLNFLKKRSEIANNFIKNKKDIPSLADLNRLTDDSPPYNKLLKAMVLSIKKGDTVSL